MYSPVDEIKSRLDIVDLIQGYIRLQKAGRNYRACCPFHSEKTPSFIISPEKQMWHCFGCGKGGSVFDFIMEMEGIEFGDALQILAQRTGIELRKDSEFIKYKTEKTKLYEICNLALCFFIKQLEASQAGKNIQKYLKKRGLKLDTLQQWKIGYAPKQWTSLYDFLINQGYSNENILKTGLLIKNNNKYYDRFRDRIIFPIFDLNGTTVGFTGRENPDNIDSKMGKYINISNTLIYDKSRILYGLDKAKINIRKNNTCILVEGQMDALMVYQSGFKNVIACSGTALTQEHLKIIKRYTDNLIMAFDMDSAGEIATKRGIDLSIQFGFNVKIADLPNGQDPADYILQNNSNWNDVIKNSKKIMEFYFASAFSKNDAKTVEGKKQISAILLPIIKKIPNKIEQIHWIQQISQRIGIQENILLEEMENIKNSNYYNQDKNNKNIIKTKKNLNTEEYILGLILSDLNNIEQIKQEPVKIFTNPDFKKIFEKIKHNKLKNLNNLKKLLSNDLSKQIDELIFKAEAYKNLVETETTIKSKNEIEFCLKKMKDSYNRKQIINNFK